MLVVVADDKRETLGFVERWFSRAYADDADMRLETHSDLDSLEDFISSKLQAKDHLLLLLDLNWDEDKTRSLKWMGRVKRSLQTRRWPVLIYSESDDEADVREAHDHFANGYVHKGVDGQEEHFIGVLDHWRNKQVLP